MDEIDDERVKACSTPWLHDALDRLRQNLRERHAADPTGRYRWEQILAIFENEAQEKPVRGGGASPAPAPVASPCSRCGAYLVDGRCINCSAPEAPSGEAVAWRYRYAPNDGRLPGQWHYVESLAHANQGPDVWLQALYAHPAPAPVAPSWEARDWIEEQMADPETRREFLREYPGVLGETIIEACVNAVESVAERFERAQRYCEGSRNAEGGAHRASSDHSARIAQYQADGARAALAALRAALQPKDAPPTAEGGK